MKGWIVGLLVIWPVTAAAAQEAWEQLDYSADPVVGGLSASKSRSQGVTAAVDQHGNPIVLWTQTLSGTTPFQLFASRWNPGQGHWDSLGPRSDSPRGINDSIYSAYAPAVALDRSDNPVVVWTEQGHLYLRRWDPLIPIPNWVPFHDEVTNLDSTVGNGISGTSPASAPSIAIARDGSMVVAWIDSRLSNNRRVLATRWNPTTKTWESLDGSASTGVSSTLPDKIANECSVALDRSGNPVIAWTELRVVNQTTSQLRVFATTWNSPKWVAIGTSLGADGLGGLGTITGGAALPGVKVQVDGQDNVYVAWADDRIVPLSDDNSLNGARHVFLSHSRGAAWTPLGDDLQVSLPGLNAECPTLAVDVHGNPILAWQQVTASGSRGNVIDIFLLKWTGSNWEEVSESANLPGGLTNSAAINSLSTATQPCVAHGAGTMFLGWTQKYPKYGLSAITDTFGLRWFNPPPTISQINQVRAGGLPIRPQGRSASFQAQALLDDPDGSIVQMELELRPVGTSFSNTATGVTTLAAGGAIQSIPVEGLTANQDYHWQVRAIDANGGASDWSSFGKQPDDPQEIDFTFTVNEDPAVVALVLHSPLSGEPIEVGGPCYTDGTMTFEVTVMDPEESQVAVHLEVRPVGVPFNGTPTASSGWRRESRVTMTARVGLGAMHLAYQVADIEGGSSPWIGFGGNDESTADFVAIANGSGGATAPSCGGSASGSSWGTVILMGLLSWIRIRPRLRPSPL